MWLLIISLGYDCLGDTVTPCFHVLPDSLGPPGHEQSPEEQGVMEQEFCLMSGISQCLESLALILDKMMIYHVLGSAMTAVSGPEERHQPSRWRKYMCLSLNPCAGLAPFFFV